MIQGEGEFRRLGQGKGAIERDCNCRQIRDRGWDSLGKMQVDHVRAASCPAPAQFDGRVVNGVATTSA